MCIRDRGGKDQADGRVLAHQPGAQQQLDQTDGDHTHGRRGQDEQRRLQGTDGEEAEDNAQQDSVADGVAHHRHTPQHEEDPRQGAGDGDDDGDE